MSHFVSLIGELTLRRSLTSLLAERHLSPETILDVIQFFTKNTWDSQVASIIYHQNNFLFVTRSRPDYATRTQPIKVLLTTLCWGSVRGVLGSVALNYLVDSVIAAQREVNLENVIAWLHQSQDSLDFLALLLLCGSLFHVFDERILNNLTSAVEEIFNLDWKINNFGLKMSQSSKFSPCRRIWGFEPLGCVEGAQGSDGPSRPDFAGGSEQPAEFSTTPCWRLVP